MVERHTVDVNVTGSIPVIRATLSRRGFIAGLFATPFVIRTPGLLMPVRNRTIVQLNPVLISLLRKTMPADLARDILGVQRMYSPELIDAWVTILNPKEFNYAKTI
jgi:secreted PhoX family phosphatase